MADRASADRACKDPNPIIDGRKANVNLAYLGAKPRVIQPGEQRVIDGSDHTKTPGQKQKDTERMRFIFLLS